MATIRHQDCQNSESGYRVLPAGSTLEPIGNGKPKGDKPKQKTPSSKSNPTAKTGDRFKVLNTFTDFSLCELSRSEIATWLVLYRDTRDGLAKTSQADIARRGGISRQHVNAAIKSLAASRLITVVKAGSLKKGTSIYRVNPLPKKE